MTNAVRLLANRSDITLKPGTLQQTVEVQVTTPVVNSEARPPTLVIIPT